MVGNMFGFRAIGKYILKVQGGSQVTGKRPVMDGSGFQAIGHIKWYRYRPPHKLEIHPFIYL